MNRCIAVTGSASGIGRATAALLSARGDRVIGIDRHAADLCCDLGDAVHRATLPARLAALTPRLDAVVAAAGISEGLAATVLSVNYFGATALLEGLRPLLAQSPAPRALVFSSVASRMPVDAAVIESCLDDDEAETRRRVAGSRQLPYATSKAALARWVRRKAIQPDWGGAGILLNAIAPGTIGTPMTQPMLDLPQGRRMLEQLTPVAIGRFGSAAEIAQLCAFLVSPENSFIAGQVIFADGGCDAIQRGDAVW